MKTAEFRDRVRIYVASGKGGDGCASFRREKFIPFGGPNGGDGGRGGSVYLQGDINEASLVSLYYEPHRKAAKGGNGRGKECYGRNGADLHIRVPCGTVVIDAETGEPFGEVLKDGELLMLARGGKGGLGNVHFKSSTNQAPREITYGEPAQERVFWLELKTIADVGLVGYPNAGKSTLITQISNAHPKIAPYPFTTMNPVLGSVALPDNHTIRIADIPGLIEGASQGVGLGHDFLRHIERTKFLLFVIDMAGTEGRDPVADFSHLRDELRLYNAEMLDRPHLVLANKMDLPTADENLLLFKEQTGVDPLPISARDNDGLQAVLAKLDEHFFPPAAAVAEESLSPSAMPTA